MGHYCSKGPDQVTPLQSTQLQAVSSLLLMKQGVECEASEEAWWAEPGPLACSDPTRLQIGSPNGFYITSRFLSR
jgi:hypothetical protein